MNIDTKELTKIVTEEAVGKIADEGVNGIKEIGSRFIGNYTKRRNVGFGVAKSFAGSFQETKNYYRDIFTGKDPVVMKEAIYFEEVKM